jgi:hypothetical protein
MQLKSAAFSIAISGLVVLVGCYLLAKAIGSPKEVVFEESTFHAITPSESPLSVVKADSAVSVNIPLSEVEISLEKTSCYGPCPVYSLYIYGDGTVLYEGIENVRVVGEQRSSISAEEVVNLVNGFLKSKFLEAPSDYTSIEIASLENGSLVLGQSAGFDGSTTTLYFRLGERSNAMHLLYNHPVEVIELIAATKNWVGDEY